MISWCPQDVAQLLQAVGPIECHVQSSDGAPWPNILLPFITTFLGAILAFYSGLKLYKHQKNDDDKSYLLFAISHLGDLTSHLYSFKEQVALPRSTEAGQQQDKLELAIRNKQSPHVQLRECAKFVYDGGFRVNLSIERLSFLADREPNLIIILGALFSAVGSLSLLAEDINKDIQNYLWDDDALRPDRALLTLQKNALLCEQVDSVLYLAEKCQALLLQFGQLQYGGKIKIKSFDLTDERYKKLKPPPIPSWENGYRWFPKKKGRWWS